MVGESGEEQVHGELLLNKQPTKPTTNLFPTPSPSSAPGIFVGCGRSGICPAWGVAPHGGAFRPYTLGCGLSA